MNTVNVATLKEKLSYYLGLVKKGQEIVVTSHRASETFPTVAGTLDAIHLATALALRQAEPIDLLLTHDGQLATAARSGGFTVLGVS